MELSRTSSPPSELFSETNDNSVATLLTYGVVRVRHPRVLEAANLTLIVYPNLYPNPPQHYPTQTDTP